MSGVRKYTKNGEDCSECEVTSIVRGYCKKHYMAAYRAGKIELLVLPTQCSVEDCPNPPVARGYCNTHYRKRQRLGEWSEESAGRCSWLGCGGPVYCRGMCHKHYALFNRYGVTSEEFFRMYVSQDGSCKICGVLMDVPCIDHDHTTSKVRGLLCAHCNHGLGSLEITKNFS